MSFEDASNEKKVIEFSKLEQELMQIAQEQRTRKNEPSPDKKKRTNIADNVLLQKMQ